jgi:hypothetical protein
LVEYQKNEVIAMELARLPGRAVRLTDHHLIRQATSGARSGRGPTPSFSIPVSLRLKSSGAAFPWGPQPGRNQQGIGREGEDDDMTPLTDEEKKAIVESFQLLKTAIIRQGPDEDARFKDFQQQYRGDLRSYVDKFPTANDKRDWVGQLGMYLHDEIEPQFWGLAGGSLLPGLRLGRHRSVRPQHRRPIR